MAFALFNNFWDYIFKWTPQSKQIISPPSLYVPKEFRVTDNAIKRKFLEENSFGTFISTSKQGRIFTSQLPFYLEFNNENELTSMRAHLALANDQYNHTIRDVTFAANKEVVVTFLGPHFYISATWFGEELKLKSVPTWNYSSMEVRGILEEITADEEKNELLSRLSKSNEDAILKMNAEHDAWIYEEANKAIMEGLKNKIRFFKIKVHAVAGKFKLSQNKPEEVIESLAEGLQNTKNQEANTVANQMLDLLNARQSATDDPV